MVKVIAVNFNYTPNWLFNFTDDFLIYDRSDSKEHLKEFPQEKIIYTENKGNVDYDKLNYLIENYENLPDSFLWIKTNLFKYISPEEFQILKYNASFTPLLTKNHLTYTDSEGWVNYYQDGIYWERNNSWYLGSVPAKNVSNFNEWCNLHNLTNNLSYIPFAPGGNYILTKETVHKYPKEYYMNMAKMLPYTQEPGEAHMAERSYYLMWGQPIW